MILDFGCGSGPVWGKRNEEVIGVDTSKVRLRVAKNKIQVLCCDGRFLPFKDHVFQRLIAESVLEHIHGYREALLEIRRVISNDGQFRLVQPVDNDPLFFVARRIAGTWNRDKIYSKFTSGNLIHVLSGAFRIVSVSYLPNSPIVGILGFFNRKTPHILSTLDGLYKMFCQTTGVFHWEVVIEARVLPRLNNVVFSFVLVSEQ